MPRRRSRIAPGKRFRAHEEVEKPVAYPQLQNILAAAGAEAAYTSIAALIDVEKTKALTESFGEKGDALSLAQRLQENLKTAIEERDAAKAEVDRLSKSDGMLRESVDAMRQRAERAEAEQAEYEGRCTVLGELMANLLEDAPEVGDDPVEAATEYIANLKEAVVELAAKLQELERCKTSLTHCNETHTHVTAKINEQLQAVAAAQEAAKSGWLRGWLSAKE